MNSGFELEVLKTFDQALDWPPDEREARLDALEPALATRVRALLKADAAAAGALPTRPPLPALLTEIVPPERIGVYRIAGLLGEGGMGAVYRGERDDGLFEQTVAIKLVRPGLFADIAAAQFVTERKVLARLKHPNIAQLFDGGADPEGGAYFIMELVQGRPITDYVRETGLDLAQAVRLVLPLCEAVQHAHTSLVVHADIKPSNILVDEAGRPKLLDFGIARNLKEPDNEAAARALTVAYASPQRRAFEPPTTADDIYALGALLYELASGETPRSAPPGELASSVPAEFAAVVRKATAGAPDARYDSAAALANDLRRFLDRLPVQALAPSASRSARLLLRRRPVAVAAAVAAAAGLVVAFAVISALYVRADAERREAERRFQQARAMSHYMLFDLFDRLSDAPGTLPIRRALADKARTYLQDLSASSHAPPEVKAETAIGYMQLAGVEGFFSSGQLGNRDLAAGYLKAAEDLLAHPPRGAENLARWRYAEGRLKLFQGFRALDQGGGDAAAAALLAEAVRRLEPASKALKDDPEPAVDLWQARLTLADAIGSAGDRKAELAGVQAALSDYAARKALFDRHEKSPLLLARSHSLTGDALYYLGQVPEAAKSYAEAERILTEEDRLRPRRSRTLMELLSARWALGTTLAELGQTGAALRLYQSGMDAGRERLRIEPDHDGLQRATNLIELERANLLAQLGRGDEALKAAAENLAAWKARWATRPDDAVAMRGYLAGLRPVAEIEAAAGRIDAACTHLREAQSGYAAYAKRFSLSKQTGEGEVALIREKLSHCPG